MFAKFSEIFAALVVDSTLKITQLHLPNVQTSTKIHSYQKFSDHHMIMSVLRSLVIPWAVAQ